MTDKIPETLAVMDAEIERAGGDAFPVGRTLIAARAAVAELIEADREYDRLVSASRSGTPGEQYKAGAQLKFAAERRGAAIAAVEKLS